MRQFNNLSNSTRTVLTLASLEAQLLHYASPLPPMYVLLALLVSGSNAASRVLQRSGVMPEAARAMVQVITRRQGEVPYIGDDMVEDFTEASIAIIEQSVILAQNNARGLKAARPGHLLVALLDARDEHVTQIFTQLRVDTAQLRSVVAAAVDAEEEI